LILLLLLLLVLKLSRLILHRLLILALRRRRCPRILRWHATSVRRNLVARVALGLIRGIVLVLVRL
jgi:hypothetical protein